MRTRFCRTGRNVFLFVCGILLASLNSIESADSQSPPDLSASVEPIDVPPGRWQSIVGSGADLIVITGGHGYPGGDPSIVTISRPDGTTHTLVTQNSVWDVVRSGDFLYAIEVAHTAPLVHPAKRTWMLKEYDLKTGAARTLKKPMRSGFERVHVHGGKLYLATRGYAPQRPDGIAVGTRLVIRTIPLDAVDQETSYSVTTEQFGLSPFPPVEKYKAFAGSLYCYVVPVTPSPRAIYRLEFGSTQFVKLVEVERMVSFCIVPDGPWLAYLCGTSSTPRRYVLGLLALDGTMDKPLRAELDPGEIRFFSRSAYGGLQYDPIDRSFIMRGNIRPCEPGEWDRFFYRIRVSNFPN